MIAINIEEFNFNISHFNISLKSKEMLTLKVLRVLLLIVMVSSRTDGKIISLIVGYGGCQTAKLLVTCCASAGVVAGILCFT
jgi:hypothetical protein